MWAICLATTNCQQSAYESSPFYWNKDYEPSKLSGPPSLSKNTFNRIQCLNIASVKNEFCFLSMALLILENIDKRNPLSTFVITFALAQSRNAYLYFFFSFLKERETTSGIRLLT